MNTIRKITLSILGGGLTVLLLSGCATMEGFGKDVEKVGDEISDAAK